MAIDPLATLNVARSHLLERGAITRAVIGEPKQPPLDELTAAVFMSGIRTVDMALDRPVRVYDVVVRLYRNFMDDGQETESELGRVVGAVMEAFEGDFTLGGNVRNVDIGGEYGDPMSAEWVHLDFSGTIYRAADVSVPLIVDAAAATFVA